MPKTPIDEQRDSLTGEDYIRTYSNPSDLNREVDTIPEPTLVQSLSHRHLRTRAGSPVPLHHDANR